jgi:hypothetical protein
VTLSSASPWGEVVAAYENNADYDLVGSLSKCRLFIHAGRILQRRSAEETQSSNNERVRDDYRKIQAELDRALTWLRANDDSTTAAAAGTNDVSYLDLSDLRG